MPFPTRRAFCLFLHDAPLAYTTGRLPFLRDAPLAFFPTRRAALFLLEHATSDLSVGGSRPMPRPVHCMRPIDGIDGKCKHGTMRMKSAIVKFIASYSSHLSVTLAGDRMFSNYASITFAGMPKHCSQSTTPHLLTNIMHCKTFVSRFPYWWLTKISLHDAPLDFCLRDAPLAFFYATRRLPFSYTVRFLLFSTRRATCLHHWQFTFFYATRRLPFSLRDALLFFTRARH